MHLQRLDRARRAGTMTRAKASRWAVVLAGGQGMRLRSLIHQVYGDDRPKQFAVLTGTKSLLRQTLDRATLLVPAERTLVVTMAGQMGYLAAELRQHPAIPCVIEQPMDRGTAAAILLSAHWILARDPQAVVVVLPSDHFVGDDGAFIDHVARMAEAAVRHPERIILLGVRPTEPETDYGWIEPGGPLAARGGPSVYQVRGFVEKPEPEVANRLLGSGGLWNTFVLAARAATLVEAGREHVPGLHERIVQITAFTGSEHERWAVRQGYEFAPNRSFSRDVLERCPARLGVMPLSGVSWRDLGTPRRVVEMLEETGRGAPWLAAVRAACAAEPSRIERLCRLGHGVVNPG
ncbi:MAG TPA: sugar phosphate nucleotidyltransferase [Terriglobales bacterium]|nr:sugar phosphate nucleotidyltransferase [Terriglobales bacterium]